MGESVSLTIVLVIGVVVVLSIARRIYGEPLRARRLLIAPLLELGIGAYQVLEDGGLPAGEWISLAITGVLSLALGAVRGGTLQLFERDGYLWQRYRLRTFVVWAGAFAARFGARLLLAAVGITGAGALTARQITSGHGPSGAMIGTLLITSGLGFLGESLVLTPRALATGIPLAPPGARAGLLGGLLHGGAGRSGAEGALPASRHSPGLLDGLLNDVSARRMTTLGRDEDAGQPAGGRGRARR